MYVNRKQMFQIFARKRADMLLVRTLSQQSVLCTLISATLLVLAIWLVSLQTDAVLLLNDHDTTDVKGLAHFD